MTSTPPPLKPTLKHGQGAFDGLTFCDIEGSPRIDLTCSNLAPVIFEISMEYGFELVEATNSTFLSLLAEQAKTIKQILSTVLYIHFEN